LKLKVDLKQQSMPSSPAKSFGALIRSLFVSGLELKLKEKKCDQKVLNGPM
jgi:hypothetical protein